MFLILFLEREKDLEWGAPYFTQPKPKRNRVSFLKYFINLNKQLNCKLHPMPKINEMLLKFEGFYYATSINLNMGYYHTQISENTSNLCTIILPWEKYCCKCQPMGVAKSPDILQYKMNDLFLDF